MFKAGTRQIKRELASVPGDPARRAILQISFVAVACAALILPGVTQSLAGEPAQNKSAHDIPPAIAACGKPANQIIFHKEHLYVFNGMSSVGLDPKQFGIHRISAPPYIANPFSADLRLFGQTVKVADYHWYPSEALFRGQAIKGIEPGMQIVPIKSQRGALVTLTLRNTTSAPVQVPVKWGLRGGPGKSGTWGFGGPFRKVTFEQYKALRRIEDNALVIQNGNTRMVALTSDKGSRAVNDELISELTIAPGRTVKHSLVLVFGDKTKVTVAATKALDPDNLLAETRSYWSGLFSIADARMPKLNGASPALQDFYRAGIISLLATRFEIPEFMFNPYYAEGGVDGGGCNSYIWGICYLPYTFATLDPEVLRGMIIYNLKMDLNLCHSFGPIRGERQGHPYYYNFYSIAWVVYTYLAVTGDYDLLAEDINGKPAFTRLYEACLGHEDLSKPPVLIDYGGNNNLLELKRTQNYTHVTPSPNAERVLTYRMLTEIFQVLGRKTPHDLIGRVETLKKLFVQKLWNEEKQWLNTLDKKGTRRISYSIQIFDTLRTGMLSEKQERGILAHLNEKEFLTEWGVHSLAKTDPGYDPRDVDWGGPGAYTGDPAELVVDLCQAGYSEEGVDILNRLLWWGELPYLPQAMRAGTKGYREDGRANIIAGASTCQVVINGLFGVRYNLGQVMIQPINHPMMDGLSLKSVQIRNLCFDIEVKDGKFSVTSEGKAITKPLGESIILRY